MRLYVEELKATTLVQEITRTTVALVPKIRLHLCKYLAPAGTFTVEITDSADNVLGSSSQTLAEMQAAGDSDLQANYYHGMVTFDLDKTLTLRPGDYKIKLSSSGYTYSDTDFIGWVKADTDPSFEVSDSGYAPSNAPYDFEIYAYERVR